MAPDQLWARPQDISTFQSTLLRNLAFLDLDLDPEYRTYPQESFTGKNTLARQKSRQAYFDWVFFHLYEKWDPETCQNRLKPYFPNLEPIQTVNLHSAFFHCLNTLKAQGVFAKDVFFRKGIFDEGKSQKLLQILANFSDAVLRKVFSAAGDSASQAIKDILNATPSKELEVAYVLPLIITYRCSLSRIMSRRKQLHEKYCSINSILAQKSRELDENFAEIMMVQTFLDENTASDGNIARIAKAFNAHWQGNSGLISLIATGGDRPQKDTLLDREFSDVYSGLRDERGVQALEDPEAGYLEKLEERVSLQRNRLQEWRALKAKIETSKIPGDYRRPRIVVPTHKNLQSPRPVKNTPSGKDLVFSPRKSPRKSVWPVPGNVISDSPSSRDGPSNAGDKPSQNLEDMASENSQAQADTKALQLSSSAAVANVHAGRNPQCHLSADLSSGLPSSQSDSSKSSHDVERRPSTDSIHHEQHKDDVSQPTGPSPGADSVLPTRSRTKTLLPQDESTLLGPNPPVKTTLHERTPQSMLLVPTQRSIIVESSPRASPKTPQRVFGNDESPWSNAALLDLSAEQDSVFKSRPKIAQSPPSSPLALRSGIMADHGH